MNWLCKNVPGMCGSLIVKNESSYPQRIKIMGIENPRTFKPGNNNKWGAYTVSVQPHTRKTIRTSKFDADAIQLPDGTIRKFSDGSTMVVNYDADGRMQAKSNNEPRWSQISISPTTRDAFPGEFDKFLKHDHGELSSGYYTEDPI